MKVTLRSTNRIVHFSGIPARLWEGTTENGLPIRAYITRMAVARGADAREIEVELSDESPTPEVAAIPSRRIL